jgi:CheY-like chemotaxis protein
MQNQPPRILFVDDHDDTRFLVKTWLARLNYEVATAENVEVGLQIARSEPFDLFLLDTRLPDGPGTELCAKIRQFDRTTPIIFYSGDAYESDAALACGAQDFVIKPEIDRLREAVARAINNELTHH